MGLDMYVTGRKFCLSQRLKDEEGYEIEAVHLRLAYWRKHANLHGYIVQTYANGEDNCQDIELGLDELHHLLEVVKEPSRMPKTEGFFFGESFGNQEEIDDDVEQLTRCIAFLESPAISKEKGEWWRSVIYRASW